MYNCTILFFFIIDENNTFSITSPGHWNSTHAEKTIDELNKLINLRSENDIQLHAEQVEKKSEILIKDYSLSSLGTFENEILEELKKSKYNDLEDTVCRFQVRYDEIIDKLDLKYIPTQL